MCPGSSDPYYIVTYYIKWVTTSWTYCSKFRILFPWPSETKSYAKSRIIRWGLFSDKKYKKLEGRGDSLITNQIKIAFLDSGAILPVLLMTNCFITVIKN